MEQSITSEKTKVRVPGYSWAVLIMLYLAAAVAPLNMFKVPSLAPLLIQNLGIPITEVGTLMSVFSVAGLILAIPGGFLVQRMGVKVALLTAIAVTGLGSIIGFFSGSLEILVASRVIEGAGMGILAVACPTGIASWFPQERRGLPLGVFTTWVPFGMLLMLVVAPFLAGFWDWQGVWAFGFIYAIVLFLIVAVAFRMPKRDEAIALHGEQGAMVGATSKEETLTVFKGSLKVLKNGKIWFLALVFCLFNALSPGGVVNFLPTYLTESADLTLTMADLMTAVAMLGVIVMEPLSGFISDKIGSRKKIIAIPSIGLVITSIFLLNPMIGFVGIWIVMMIHLSMCSSGISVGTYSSAPELAGKPEYSGMALGIVGVGQNIGLLAGPLVFTNVLASTGSWSDVGLFWLVPGAIVLAILTFFLRVK